VEPRVDVITLGVADLRRAREFYQALDWYRAGDTGGTVTFGAGELTIALRDRTGGGTTLGFSVESVIDIELVLAEARGAGGTITEPASRDPGGGYRGTFLDPDGHAWTITSS
jgi:uncharacterized protein